MSLSVVVLPYASDGSLVRPVYTTCFLNLSASAFLLACCFTLELMNHVSVLSSSCTVNIFVQLVTQRANKGNTGTYNNIWVFPGGIVEKGEGLRTAAVRELLEETGITVEERSLCPIALWQAAVIPRTFAPPHLPSPPLLSCICLASYFNFDFVLTFLACV